MLKAGPDESTTEIVKDIENILLSIDIWSAENLEKEIRSFASNNSHGLGKVIMPLRLAAFGSLDGCFVSICY